MVILAYDCQGVLVCHPVREGLTVNAAYYSSFLVYQLRRAVRTKRPELLDNAIILHDNATVHTAATLQLRLQRWRWDVLQHPPYSPDLRPCDYDLIPKVKKPFCGKRFANKQDILTAFQREVSHLAIHMQRMVFSAYPIAGNEQWKPWVIILKVFNKWRLVLFM